MTRYKKYKTPNKRERAWEREKPSFLIRRIPLVMGITNKNKANKTIKSKKNTKIAGSMLLRRRLLTSAISSPVAAPNMKNTKAQKPSQRLWGRLKNKNRVNPRATRVAIMKGKKTNIQNAPFKAAKAIIKKQWLNGNQKQDSWYKR